MQIEAAQFLRLTENAHTLAFFDIEASGLRGDYNSVLCVSVKPFDEKPYTFAVKQVGNDQRVVRESIAALEKYDVICGYYSKGFDAPMLQTRALKWGQPAPQWPHHIDMYYSLKAKTLTARRSQGHLLSWLETPESKMTVSADVWNQIGTDVARYMPTMIERCESDVVGLEALYRRTRHLIKEIKKG